MKAPLSPAAGIARRDEAGRGRDRRYLGVCATVNA